MSFCVSCENFKQNELVKEFGFCKDYPEPVIKKHFKSTGFEVHVFDDACKNYKQKQLEVVQNG